MLYHNWDMLLRPAEPVDAIAVAHVHVRSWQVAYRTLMPDDYLDQLRPEDRCRAGKPAQEIRRLTTSTT